MTDFTLVLLPGLDGTGMLFRPLLAYLPPELRPLVVDYPTDERLGYEELLPRVLDALPTSSPFVLLGESFSGPLALMAAARSPVGLRGVILCASFVRNPLPAGSALLRHLVRGFCFRAAPQFARSWALLGGYATPELRRLSCEAIDAVSPHVLAHRVRAVLKVDVRRELDACHVPVLCLRGTHDRLVARRNGNEVVARCSFAEIAEVPAPHFVLQAQPVAAAAVVSKFVAELPSNPPLERTAAAVYFVCGRASRVCPDSAQRLTSVGLMQCAISTGLTQQKLLAAIPKRYRAKLPPLRAGGYTLLKFRSAREDVVLSRVVEAALSRLGSHEQLVAVGGSFTMEALTLLQARGAIVVQLSEFGWTDDRYIAIRAGRPAH